MSAGYAVGLRKSQTGSPAPVSRPRSNPATRTRPAAWSWCAGSNRRSSVLSRVRADVLLIAPGVGNGDAMGWLYDALPKAWKALDRRPDAQLVVWVSPHAGTQLLALLMEHTDDMTIEEAS